MHPAIEEVLKERMGFAAETVGRSLVDKIVRRRIAESGSSSADEYLRLLDSSPAELSELIDAIAIPETWFFRDPQAFTALADWSIRTWLRGNTAGVLRILSLPCSTGEEAYSIVMALFNAGLSRTRFEVDAIDISAAHLAKAQKAIYTRNSFRKSDPDILPSYFTIIPSGHQICKSVRDLVRFRKGNLFDPEWQIVSQVYDVIFCRNLMIYFGTENQQKAMRTLDRMLKPTGILFVGSAETYIAKAFGYEPLEHRMSFGYRKTGTRAAKVLPVSETQKQRKEALAALQSIAAKQATEPKSRAARGDSSISKSSSKIGSRSRKESTARLPAVSLEHARRLADSGDLRTAETICTHYLEKHRSSSECHYLLGLIADSRNDPEAAADFYRKALYLDPNHEQALTHLALIAEKSGDLDQAKRLRTRARRAADRRPSDSLRRKS